MKTWNKVLMLLLMLFLLVWTVFAISPVLQQPSGDVFLLIEYPKLEYLALDSDFTANFHVYNSTGFLTSNTSTDCFFYLYNESGGLLFQKELEYSQSDNEFYVNIGKGNLSYVGSLVYLLNCNGTEAGFISSAFEVTKTGTAPSPNDTLQISLIIGLLTLIVVFLFFGSYYISRANNALKEDSKSKTVKDLIYFCVGFFFLSLAGLFLSNLCFLLMEFSKNTSYGEVFKTIFVIFSNTIQILSYVGIVLFAILLISVGLIKFIEYFKGRMQE